MNDEIIFFGNGELADFTKQILEHYFEIIFHVRTEDDLKKVKRLKLTHPDAHAVLASFGVILHKDILDLFEPEGIINIHPSELPDLRGPSPIETALLRGDNEIVVSIMKLSEEMDAGPLYYQCGINFTTLLDPNSPTPEAISNFTGIPTPAHRDAATIKSIIYSTVAGTAATWLVHNLDNLVLREPGNQAGKPTFCSKLDTSMSALDPSTHTAAELHRQIIAHAGFPKSRLNIANHDVIVLSTHIAAEGETPIIPIEAKDGKILSIDRLQPEGRKPMDAQSFKNGYMK